MVKVNEWVWKFKCANPTDADKDNFCDYWPPPPSATLVSSCEGE